jgi:hypothetical protein
MATWRNSAAPFYFIQTSFCLKINVQFILFVARVKLLCYGSNNGQLRNFLEATLLMLKGQFTHPAKTVRCCRQGAMFLTFMYAIYECA